MNLRYLSWRLAACVPIVLGVTVICFVLVYIGPVDPVAAVTPDGATAEQIAAVKALYGFDKPLPVQYLTWLWRALTGDLGRSIQSGQPVAEMLFPAIGNTLRLALFSAVLSFLLAFAVGIASAASNGSWLDRILTSFSSLVVSIPSYWLGILLVAVFSVELGWLPAMGMGGRDTIAWQNLILPAIAVGAVPFGLISKSTRAAILEVRSQEYVQALEARGLPEWKIMLAVVRNAAPTVLAICGLQFGQMLGGSVLVETIFSWPGSGQLLFQSIFKRDLPVLQSTILVIAMMFVAINLLVDLLQGALDPRIERK